MHSLHGTGEVDEGMIGEVEEGRLLDVYEVLLHPCVAQPCIIVEVLDEREDVTLDEHV